MFVQAGEKGVRQINMIVCERCGAWNKAKAKKCISCEPQSRWWLLAELVWFLGIVLLLHYFAGMEFRF